MTTPYPVDSPATSRCRGWTAAIALLAGAVLTGCGESPPNNPPIQPPRPPQRPDVVLITLDTVRRDHLGCYGYTPSVTPHLDRLCQQGLRLTRAFAVAPVTLPAHASMLTGRYPPSHGARYNGETRLREEALTLAEILQAQGYATAAFVSSFVLDRRFGLAQGFEVYDDRVDAPGAPFSGVGNERSGQATTDAALRHLQQRPRDQPHFLWVHYFDAHTPYLPVSQNQPGTERQRYAGEIARVDTQVGRILQALRERDRPTWILVLADHGEGLGEHQERTHGLFVYDGTVHIPWIISGPGLQPGDLDTLVSQIDLLPTVLARLDLPQPAELDGRDVLAEAAPHASVYMETLLPYYDFALAPLHALRAVDRKYIEAPRPEYYRLDQDPREQVNLLAERAPSAEVRAESTALAHQLDERLQEWPEVGQDTGSALDDAEAVARLRSLGYLSGTDLGQTGGDPKDAVAVVHANQDAAEAAAAGRTTEAITILGKALEQMPDARGVRYLRARLLAQEGRFREALPDVERINAQVPSTDSLLLQAQLLVASGQPTLAGPLLDLAAERDPRHGGIWVVRGDLAALARDFGTARQHYQQAITLDGARVGRQAQARLARLPPR